LTVLPKVLRAQLTRSGWTVDGKAVAAGEAWFVARNSSRSARRPAKPVASGCTSTWWLGKETVTEDQTVKGKVRKEGIDVDDCGGERRK
jgi:hypothetical protein